MLPPKMRRKESNPCGGYTACNEKFEVPEALARPGTALKVEFWAKS